MKFDYTHGKEAKYMVSIHGWNFDDHYYFGEAAAAKKMFKEIAERKEKGITASLWDMKRDIRKDFIRG